MDIQIALGVIQIAVTVAMTFMGWQIKSSLKVAQTLKDLAERLLIVEIHTGIYKPEGREPRSR